MASGIAKRAKRRKLTKYSEECLINEVIKNDLKNSEPFKLNLSEKYSVLLLKNLKSQFDQSIFCDLNLVSAVDETKISVHRNVLAASSQYFSAMFSSGMDESKVNEISLIDVNGTALRLLIDYCYSGEIEITNENVVIILAAASRYEFVRVEEECSRFLEHFLKLNPLNCLSYLPLADQYTLDGLKNLSHQLACKHFMEIKETDEFLLLDAHQLLKLIKSDELKVAQEKDVYLAVMAWINYDKKSRKKFIQDLFRSIRFIQIEITFLKKKIVPKLLSNGMNQLNEDILNYKKNTNYTSPTLPECVLKPRNSGPVSNEVTSMLLYIPIGGRITKYSLNDGKWESQQHFDFPDGHEIYSMVQWRNSCFILSAGGNISCLDLKTFTVVSVPKMSCSIENGALLIHKNYLYVMGRKMIQRYDLIKKVWIGKQSMHFKGNLMATFLNDEIYCVKENAISIKSVYAKQSFEPPIITDKIEHLISYNGCLYAATAKCVHKYDIRTKVWSITNYKENQRLTYNCSNKMISVKIRSINSTKARKLTIKMYCPETNCFVDNGLLRLKQYSSDNTYFFFLREYDA